MPTFVLAAELPNSAVNSFSNRKLENYRMKNDPLPLIRFTVDDKKADIRKVHPLDIVRFVRVHEQEIIKRLMDRRIEPFPPELPLPELLHCEPDVLEVMMRFSSNYRARLTDAQATLRRRMFYDSAGADAHIATGKMRNGHKRQPKKELNGERLRDRRWLVRDWPEWARKNVAEILATNKGQKIDPSALVVQLAQRCNLNCGILFRFHRNSEKFRKAVKEAGGRFPDRIAKRKLLSEHGVHIPGTKAIPVNIRLSSPQWFKFEQWPIK
jgi:hypothetical protein